jgi:hypothetical protein
MLRYLPAYKTLRTSHYASFFNEAKVTVHLQRYRAIFLIIKK